MQGDGMKDSTKPWGNNIGYEWEVEYLFILRH